MFLRLAVFGFVTLMLTCVSHTGTLLPFAFFHRIALRRLATVFSRSLQIKTFRRGKQIDQVFVGVYGHWTVQRRGGSQWSPGRFLKRVPKSDIASLTL